MTNTLLDILFDLAAPAACAGCGRRGVALCTVCCRAPTDPVRRVVSDSAAPLEVWAAAEYSGVARDVILEFKRRGARSLRSALIEWAAAAIAVWFCVPRHDAPTALVPLHSGASTRTSAGADVPVVIAKGACRWLRRRGIRIAVMDVLGAVGRGPTQKSLGAAQRFQNVRGSLAVRAGPHPCVRCILFDDVMTTGASMLEARRVLERAGLRVMGGASVGASAAHRSDTRIRGSTLRDSVVPWHPPGSVVARNEAQWVSRRKPMPAAGETAHVRTAVPPRGWDSV